MTRLIVCLVTYLALCSAAAAQTTQVWSWTFSAANVVDSNIDHDRDPVGAIGAVLAAGFDFVTDPKSPWFELEYELAGHAYTGTNEWNRVSHLVRATFERKLAGPLSLETIGEIALHGTSEDRELADQYMILPRLKIKLPGDSRVRVFGASRLKRFSDGSGRDALNRYAGAEFRHKLGNGDEWAASGRYEVNEAELARFQFRRWTYAIGYDYMLGPLDTIELDLKYRFQHYAAREVKVAGIRELRQDRRLTPSLSWTHALSRWADLVVAYEFDSRASNDPDKHFTAHATTVRLNRRW